MNIGVVTYEDAKEAALKGDFNSQQVLDDIERHLQSGGEYTITQIDGTRKKFILNESGNVEIES